ncbi:MAG: hypothetical protein KF884_12780 [Fimbriimonadaceae bacterium]|nr:hypothetical protein [Fimbriimonadaceae bacterium]QYK58416.1 MAG: hypothetical protein KF884_12780 [Fimbriimonadaceae bacterium]
MKRELSRKSWLILGAIGLGLAGLVMFLMNRERPEVAVARSNLEAFLKGDLWALYESCSPNQRNRMNLTKAQVQKIADELVLPRLARFTANGPIKTSFSQALGEGVASVELLAPNGATYDLSMDAILVGDRPHVSFSMVMITVWHLEALTQNPKATSSVDGLNALINGLDRDRERLEAHGVKGHAGRSGDRFKPWFEVRADWVKVRDQLVAARSN